MASAESELREALAGQPGVDPRIVAFRARAWPLLAPLLLCLVVLLAVMFKLMASKHSSDPIAPLLGVEAAVIVVTFWLMPRAMAVAQMRGQGRSGYALSDAHLLVVTADGRSMCVPLSGISAVALENGMPVVTLEGSLQDGEPATLTWEVGMFKPLSLVGRVACPTSAERFVDEVKRRLGPAAARPPKPAAPRPAAADISPEGASYDALEAPLTEPAWRGHVTPDRELERLRLGPYELVFVDARGAPAGMIRYTYRLMVFPQGSTSPVFAYNHELSAMGTCCYGTHEGSTHTNLGEAPEDISFEDFRGQALDIALARLTRPA